MFPSPVGVLWVSIHIKFLLSFRGRVSVPCRGSISFYPCYLIKHYWQAFVSVPCRGSISFYDLNRRKEDGEKVSVPYRGSISFYDYQQFILVDKDGFRPLSGFYKFLSELRKMYGKEPNVSVPCRGSISFYENKTYCVRLENGNIVSVPCRGSISFYLCVLSKWGGENWVSVPCGGSISFYSC